MFRKNNDFTLSGAMFISGIEDFVNNRLCLLERHLEFGKGKFIARLNNMYLLTIDENLNSYALHKNYNDVDLICTKCSSYRDLINALFIMVMLNREKEDFI